MKRSLKKLKGSKQARERYKVWLKQGQYDLLAAKSSLEHKYYEWTAYQAEQAVEKALKAVLVHAGYRAPRMHKLPVLLGMCNQVNEKIRETKFSFKHLESFTFISRYPFLIPGKNETPHELISKADAHEALNQAEIFLQQIKIILREPMQGGDSVKIEDTFTEEEVKIRLKEVKDVLIREFHPQKIILFGSFARNHTSTHSGTMDLLIIAETKLPFIERIKKARIATKGDLPIIEPLIYTPEEFRFMTEEEGEGFLENALEEGRVIYKN